jgi:hypothetical protein
MDSTNRVLVCIDESSNTDVDSIGSWWSNVDGTRRRGNTDLGSIDRGHNTDKDSINDTILTGTEQTRH